MSELLKWKLYLIGSAAFLRVESLVHQLIPFLTLLDSVFISCAAAFVNVTTSRRSTSTGFSSLIIFLIIRSTNTAVLPDPAAAATKISRPLATTAFHWSSVH